MEMCYKILSEEKQVTQRELFYKLICDSPDYFSSQLEVNRTIQGHFSSCLPVWIGVCFYIGVLKQTNWTAILVYFFFFEAICTYFRLHVFRVSIYVWILGMVYVLFVILLLLMKFLPFGPKKKSWFSF